jgi:DNA-binding transcriptional ArsR family regulator
VEVAARRSLKHGLGSSRQAISQHVDVLEDAGLIRVRRAGRYKFHDLDLVPLEQADGRWLDTAPTQPEDPK